MCRRRQRSADGSAAASAGAPLVENSRRRVGLLTALLFSLPARRSSTTATRSAWATTSILAPQRRADADAMGGDRNGGFSRSRATVRAASAGSVCGCRRSASAQGGIRSLLNWMKRVVSLRRQHRCSGAAHWNSVIIGTTARFSPFLRRTGGSIMVVANLRAPSRNLSARSCPAR